MLFVCLFVVVVVVVGFFFCFSYLETTEIYFWVYHIVTIFNLFATEEPRPLAADRVLFLKAASGPKHGRHWTRTYKG